MSNGVIAQLFSGRLDQELLRVVPPPEDEETLEILLSALDRFLEREVDGASIDREGHLPESVLLGCKQLGLFGLVIPEEFGGFGLGARSYFKIMERVAAACGATAVTLGAHQSIGLKALLLAGSQEQKQMWLPACASGERIAAFALTEPEAGSDAASIKTRLVEEGDDLILDGGKIWITNGGFASLFTVFARLGDTIRAVIVPRELHGLSTGEEEKKLGIRGSSTTTVTFESVRVPRANLLSGDGF
ncbi:MAG: acyl-CoA dehydrogenase family protein, partial [Planctomycetota bacterium]|nr:acyl-CoA dehydrogenase family protein [Planctomycetota bacterium]